jgi:hypothetical protein
VRLILLRPVPVVFALLLLLLQWGAVAHEMGHGGDGLADDACPLCVAYTGVAAPLAGFGPQVLATPRLPQVPDAALPWPLSRPGIFVHYAIRAPPVFLAGFNIRSSA